MSLKEFFREGWHVLEPSVPLDWNWHIDAICDHVQTALDDWYEVVRWKAKAARDAVGPSAPSGGDCTVRPEQRIKDLIINVPPGTAKSRIVSVYTPAWMWLVCPSWRAYFFSGNPEVSIRDSMMCRELIRSEWYQETFKPVWTLARDQDGKTSYRNTAGGFRIAKGVRAKVTGGRGDAIFFDDPNDAAEIESDAERDAVNNWYDQGAGNRVNDLRTSIRVGIQQRLHEDDWTGHVLPLGDFFHLPIPMEFDPSPFCTCKSCTTLVNPIGWADPRTTVGELMMPQRFPVEVLAAELKRLGTNGYAGQYEQRPSAKGGSIFRESWFANRYRSMPEFVAVGTFWDTSLKEKEENDESAFVTVGRGKDGGLYVLRSWHGHEETPDLGKRLVDGAAHLRSLFGDRYLGDFVEDKVSGTTLMQYLRRTNPGMPVIGISVDADKVARAKGVSPIAESQSVRLPDAHIYPATFEWVRDLIGDLTGFPRAKRKDLVDAFVYACKWYMGTLKVAGAASSKRGKRGGLT
jgi:predicted phage terminase large subunit-like protein